MVNNQKFYLFLILYHFLYSFSLDNYLLSIFIWIYNSLGTGVPSSDSLLELLVRDTLLLTQLSLDIDVWSYSSSDISILYFLSLIYSCLFSLPLLLSLHIVFYFTILSAFKNLVIVFCLLRFEQIWFLIV